MGSVDGGFDLGLAPVKGIEEGETDRRVVKGSAVAHLVGGIA